MARSAVASPCPPPSATTAGPAATVDVTVVHPRRHAVRFEQSGQLGGDHHAAMTSAGATDPDREVRLAFAHERGEQECEHPLELLEERPGLGLAQHVVADPGIRAGERPQLLDP